MKRVLSILALLLLCFTGYSQTESKTDRKSEEIEIYFDHNSYAMDLDLRNNRESLASLSRRVEELNSDTLTVISKIEVNSYASPEGGRIYNQKLSKKRSSSISDYLRSTISLPDSLIEISCTGTDWDGLIELVEESDMEYKGEVIEILNTVPDETWAKKNPNDKWMSLVDSRNRHLMELRGGVPYKYMISNIYPSLRRGSVVTIYFKTIVAPAIAKAEIVEAKIVEPEPTEEVVELTPINEPAEVVELAEVEPAAVDGIVPLFALKTNLLFDVATILNIEAEVPIRKRWSVAGEWIFPWWTTCGCRGNAWQSGESSSRNSLEVLNANIEGRYWFGDREKREVMTGWNVGLYAGGGKYDLERNAKGYQGEFFIAAGLSGGYAHTISKSGNLRMEYSVGIGYLKTDYRYYEEHWGINDKWHTLRQNSGEYTWFGPTRARVSLVWMLNRKVNKEK